MKKKEYPDSRESITESWQRCIAIGLDHDDEPIPQQLTARELADFESRHDELLAVTELEVAPYYRNVLSSSRCLILLTDRHGIVLRSWGDQRITETRLRPWFKIGANWQEQHCGTNAIGTAIATGSPIQVQRNEHFLKMARSIIGSAAPILDANKQIGGVLCVFSDAYLPQAHTLGMVRLLSQSVENRLISRQFGQDHFQLTLNTTADNFDSPWSGILVCDDRGDIVASNQRAEQLLNTPTAGRNLDDLFTARRNFILGYPEHEPVQLTTRGKVRLSARLRKPQTNGETARKSDADVAPPSSVDEWQIDRLEYGDSVVRQCAARALKVLERDVPLLITGETGVGKEVLVRALHGACNRRDQPLVAVNCAAIPPELVESELFGYEPGAFTGARSQGSLGFIRKAHKGILFLDEIGEMPVSAQSRLLRVLQERVVTPVGSTNSLPVDILLITATNRSLSERIDRGQFRADLYYRINGLSVSLPPLRERTDKQALIQSVYSRFRDPDQPLELSPRILSALEEHPWPGNIRQLVNVLKVAIALADGEHVQLWHLPEDFLAEFHSSPATNYVNVRTDDAASPVNDMETREADAMGETLRAFQRYQGNISQAARALSISRNTLYKRLRELGVR